VAHRIQEKKRRLDSYTSYWFGKWVKMVMPIVKKMIDEEWAAKSIYARAYHLSRRR